MSVADETILAGISLRPLEPCDMDFLARLYATTRAEEMALLSHWSHVEKAAFLDSQFKAQHDHYQMHYAGARFDIVTRDGLDIGRFYVYPMEQELRLMDITLLPELRGRGIGGALLRALQAEAEAAGKMISLYVEEQNPARRLYERHGFEEAGEASFYKLMTWRPKGAATAATTAS